MERIKKASAVDLAAIALRKEIASGQWIDRLPGSRVLAKRLGVSPPTVAAALTQLAEEGLLEGGGQRRAFWLVGRARASSRKTVEAGPKRLLILTHEELGQLVEVSRRLIEKLRDQMAARGWVVEYQVLDFLHVKHPQRSWDRSIHVDPGTRVIALYGRTPLAEWAFRRKVRMLFVGGNPGSFPIPLVAVKSSVMAEIALAKLTALGHWRIVMPLCDRAAPFKSAMRAATRHAIEATGQSYIQSYHNPESAYLKPDITWRIIESAFASNPPTALVLLDWKELVTAHCFLSKMGLKIPEDVSVIILSDQIEADWFQPKLTRFRIPVRRLLKSVVRWLESGDNDSPHTMLPSDFIEAATVAPPKS
ncbi:MAG: hypothetical protein CFE26_12590, partial [Verrucomicrobiales bacterium VVV1]